MRVGIPPSDTRMSTGDSLQGVTRAVVATAAGGCGSLRRRRHGNTVSATDLNRHMVHMVQDT